MYGVKRWFFFLLFHLKLETDGVHFFFRWSTAVSAISDICIASGKFKCKALEILVIRWGIIIILFVSHATRYFGKVRNDAKPQNSSSPPPPPPFNWESHSSFFFCIPSHLIVKASFLMPCLLSWVCMCERERERRYKWWCPKSFDDGPGPSCVWDLSLYIDVAPYIINIHVQWTYFCKPKYEVDVKRSESYNPTHMYGLASVYCIWQQRPFYLRLKTVWHLVMNGLTCVITFSPTSSDDFLKSDTSFWLC